jgi:MFS family permease
MFKKIKHQRPHYFSKHPSRGLIGMYWSVGLMDLGIAAVIIFEPIFLFVQGYSLQWIMFFYILVYGLYILLLPFLGRMVGKIGYEHSIFYSQFFLIAYYISLFAISQWGFFFYIAPFMYAIQKSLYWPAYHADMSVFSTEKQRGREVGGLETLSIIVYIIGPLIGGIILEWAGFGLLFTIVSVLFILSALPLLRIREVHSQQEFSYGDVFKKLIDKEHRRNFFAFLGFGEELIVMAIWPIFIYIVLKDYLEIGSLVAVATLVTSFLVLYLGKISDKYSKENILRVGSIFYFLSWIIRGFAGRAWHILSLDAVSRMSKEMIWVPMTAMMYSTGKRLGSLTHAVFFEQSLAIGKFVAAVLVLIIVWLFPSPWIAIFILAGLFSLMYMLYKQR